jgi:hypothetical protein
MGTRSFKGPGGRDPEVAGEVLVGVLGQDEPGGPQDGPGVFAWWGEDVDGVVAGAVCNNEPLVVGENNAGPFRGVPAVGGMPGGSRYSAWSGPRESGCGAGGAGSGGSGGLPSAAGESGGGLGGERGRCEDAGGEQDVFQPAGHAARGFSGMTGRGGVAGWPAGCRYLVPGAGRSRRGGACARMAGRG